MFEKIVLSGFADEIAASLDTQMQVLDQLQMRHIEMRGRGRQKLRRIFGG